MTKYGRNLGRALLWVVGAASLSSCGSETEAPPDYQWGLPEGVPAPAVPEDNPMSDARVELGRHLFFDLRLSGNEEQACASCHLQERAFSEDRPVSVGSTGEVHPRNAPSLANAGYAATLTWANPLLTSLELQAPIPLFGEHPVEMGVLGREEEVLARLRADPNYASMFPEAFRGEADPVNFDNIVRALASFQRTLLSFNAPFDRFSRGEDQSALSASAIRGMQLFFSERLECFHCHGGFLFTESVAHEGSVIPERPFHNTGQYNVDGRGGYPAHNTGLFEISGRPEDMGRFRAPTLRNIEVTGPYMHDGSVATLSEVIDNYARGGKDTSSGPHRGDGALNPFKSGFVRAFSLSADEKEDVLTFLRSLTDSEFLSDPRFSDPFNEGRN